MKRTNISKSISDFSQRIKWGIGKLPKNRATALALVGLLIITFALITINLNTAYAVKVNGKTVGVVKEKEDFDKVIDKIKDNFRRTYSAEMVLSEAIEFEKVKVKKDQLTTPIQLESSLKQILNLRVKGFVIKANGKLVSVLATKEDAEKVLDKIKKSYIDGEDTKEVYFGENVAIEETAIEISKIASPEDTVEYIRKGTVETKIHEVQKGESFWGIAKKYNMGVEELQKANPNVNPEKLQIKQPINLVVPKPLITVVTIRRSRFEEKMPFPIEFEETTALYKGETKIKVAGKDGRREVYAEIVEHNDLEVSRNILEEKILEEPKLQIVLKGTKPTPAKIGTGSFNNPTRGTLTSRFGSRWGRMHEGIDVSARIGTNIAAADGGKVTFAGTNGAYGKLVIIDHGGGFQTYYAHCSKILVSKGDNVHKGQKIAEVGNTGRSTGPHLHFEVRKNGKPVNPLSYVKY